MPRLTLAGGATLQASPQFAPDNGDVGFYDSIAIIGTNTINARGGSYGKNNWFAGGFKAPCDLSETAEAFQLRMDVPGVKPEDITVEVRGDTVHVRGERKTEKEEKEKTYHRVERQVAQHLRAEPVAQPHVFEADHPNRLRR